MPFSAKKDNLLQVPSFAPHIAGALYGALARTASPALRHLPSSTARKPSHRQAIFIGLDLSTTPTDQPDADEGLVDLTWSLAVSDGFGVTNTERGEKKGLDLRPGKGGIGLAVARLVLRLREFEETQRYKIHLVALSDTLPECFLTQEPLLLPTLWQKLDVIPFLIPGVAPTAPASPRMSFFPPPQGEHHARKHIDLSFLPPQTQRAVGEDHAQRAVREAVKALAVSVHSATSVECSGEDMEVEVDRKGEVVLCSLRDYEQTTSPGLWKQFKALSTHMSDNNISVSFFSATPQGGGVALMRHALVRLWRLVGVDVRWYTPEGHPAVFNITKAKFHNVLQGVNDKGIKLKDVDKEIYERWTEANLDTFWSERAIRSSVIVIDDPQLAALIPLIRQRQQNAKIIFRSHIQIDTSLVDDPTKGDGVHADVWNYLWSFIQGADIFLAHPVKAFVPKNVLDSGVPVMYMPPSTDPLDGLNKPIGESDLEWYHQYFNRLSEQQCGVHINFSRPYIVQVARFDPSKGIPHLLAAYLIFRQKLRALRPPPALNEIPALVLTGHGSVDDPDGQPIFEAISQVLQTEAYLTIRSDVAYVRVPPCDRTLGAILQGAWCCMQLSTKEGFEVKVTEAVRKRIPVIASKAGGIPLQIREGINGWLHEPTDHEGVANRLIALHKAKKPTLSGPASLAREGLTPNLYAEDLISDIFAPLPPINPHATAANGDAAAGDGASEQDKTVGTSEDFWTIGNAVKWMILWSRLEGTPVHPNTSDEEKDILRPLLGEKLVGDGQQQQSEKVSIWEGLEGRAVWETVMGKRDDSLVIG